jgi:hypothetical protein
VHKHVRVCVTVNRHNCYTEGSYSPHDVTEHEYESPMVNVLCTLMKNKVMSPFYFEEPTGTSDTFLGVMENNAL